MNRPLVLENNKLLRLISSTAVFSINRRKNKTFNRKGLSFEFNVYHRGHCRNLNTKLLNKNFNQGKTILTDRIFGCGTKQPIFKTEQNEWLQPICMELDLFEEVHICCMARSLRSLRQVATLRHGHMARRSASLRSCI